ncbi:tetratricopeptide repeat protein [Fluviicola sp.]|uniref:tetratricopeptide repeat protein n=1 Tax=Fluviicola sp. TaxID=1917219 RepID=UPI003D2D9C71
MGKNILVILGFPSDCLEFHSDKMYIWLQLKTMSSIKYIILSWSILLGLWSFGQKEDYSACMHLNASERLLLQNTDSALTEALKAKQELQHVRSIDLKIEILQNLGDCYKFRSDFASSMKYYLQAKKMVDKAVSRNPNDLHLNLLKADSRLKIGVLYLQLKNFKKSIAYQEEALLILEQADKRTSKMEIVTRKLKVYNNLAAVFISQNDYEMALVYFRNALDLNKQVKNQSYESSILNNIGICHLEQRELDLASHYFQKSFKIRKQVGDELGQAQVLNSLGKNEVFRGNFSKASEYFEQALSLGRKTGSNSSTLISLESLSTINDTLGNYKEALYYYKKYKELNDQIFNLESKTAIASLEEAHQREQDKKAYELKLKQNESDKLRNLVLVVILFLVLLVAVFFIFVMRSRIRTAQLQQDKLTLERENLDLAHKTLEEDLEFKERELTAKALFMLKNTELLERVMENLQKAKRSLSKESQQQIQEIITDLQLGQRNNGWEEFEVHFTRVHSQFYESLQDKFPNLTSNEKKLCAFLRLNMSTKDISAITNQSVNSITVARTRLRKKLGIDGEDVHLINFLMTL